MTMLNARKILGSMQHQGPLLHLHSFSTLKGEPPRVLCSKPSWRRSTTGTAAATTTRKQKTKQPTTMNNMACTPDQLTGIAFPVDAHQIRRQADRVHSMHTKSADRHTLSGRCTPGPLTGTAFPADVHQIR